MRVAQMSDTQPIDVNSAALGIGRHVSGIADPFNGHIDEFRIAHIQRSNGWIETTSDERGRVARSACYGAGGLGPTDAWRPVASARAAFHDKGENNGT